MLIFLLIPIESGTCGGVVTPSGKVLSGLGLTGGRKPDGDKVRGVPALGVVLGDTSPGVLPIAGVPRPGTGVVQPLGGAGI